MPDCSDGGGHSLWKQGGLGGSGVILPEGRDLEHCPELPMIVPLAVSLPINEVLQVTIPTSRIQDVPYSVDGGLCPLFPISWACALGSTLLAELAAVQRNNVPSTHKKT